jgi:hypothetical protein
VVPVAVDESAQVGQWSDQVAQWIEPKRLDRGPLHGPDRRPRRFSYPTAMTQMGQEDQLPPRRASDRCGFGERTFPETRGNDEVAPLAAIP